MPTNQKHNGTESEGIANVGIHGMPRSPEIKQQSAAIKYIGQQSVQYSDTHNGVIFVHFHDINHESDDVSSTGKSNTGYHVETKPEAPGRFL